MKVLSLPFATYILVTKSTRYSMEHSTHNINYMKYITLFLLISVLLYGIDHTTSSNQAIATSSSSIDELPIYSVDTDKPILALTFDSAWGDEDLEDILTILEKHNAPATFFVTGTVTLFVDKWPYTTELGLQTVLERHNA